MENEIYQKIKDRIYLVSNRKKLRIEQQIKTYVLNTKEEYLSKGGYFGDIKEMNIKNDELCILANVRRHILQDLKKLNLDSQLKDIMFMMKANIRFNQLLGLMIRV